MRCAFSIWNGLFPARPGFCGHGRPFNESDPRLHESVYGCGGGALAESKKGVDLLKGQASSGGKTLEAFIAKHLKSIDPDFQASGRAMMSSVERMRHYESVLAEWKGASAWEKPFLFFSNLDRDLLSAVSFQPALPLTYEGAVYALAGVLVGMFFFSLFIKTPYYLLGGRKRRFS